MGAKNSKTSDIDYRNIRTIEDINLYKLPKRCDHLITYENGEDIIVSFSLKKESKFRNRHRFAILYKPINDIYFIDIKKIDNYKDDSVKDNYSFTLIYNEQSKQKSQDFTINKFQNYLFWKLLQVLNPIVYKENKSLRTKESDL